ncbi:MAG: hypothetical protein V4736_02660 [Bdellovibrionota bacterium]
MKRYMAIYLGSESEEAMKKWQSMDPVTRKAKDQEGMTAWMNWGVKYNANILDHGAPLGKTKHVSAKGISDTKNRMAAYTIVQAESHEEAAKIFLNHPHFTIFPGDSVEIMECLPMPSM